MSSKRGKEPSHRRPLALFPATVLAAACHSRPDGDATSRTYELGPAEKVIGAVDGPGADVFATVKDIEVDNSGNVYVIENDVRVFHPTGRILGTAGRPGQGPGEFGNGAPGARRSTPTAGCMCLMRVT
jgi:hypothetical protein